MNKKKATYMMLMFFIFLGTGFLLVPLLKNYHTIWIMALSLLVAMLSDRIVPYFVNRLYN